MPRLTEKQLAVITDILLSYDKIDLVEMYIEKLDADELRQLLDFAAE